MAGNKSYTIVEYFGGDDGYRCGYCKNEKGNFSNGMWSHTMTVQDYQDLIDRGWRRSGKYVYKPTLKKTCCPQYTIRCHAQKFQPSKSHKKVLKKMSKFISQGELPIGREDEEPMDSVWSEAGPREPTKACQSDVTCADITDIHQEVPKCPPVVEVQEELGDSSASSSESSRKDPVYLPKPGKGADPNRPPCRKAKDLRKERRLQKDQIRQHADVPNPNPTRSNQPKSLEDFIRESLGDDASHQLEVRLVRSNPPSPQFKASFDASYQVYKLYQMAIHKDPPHKPSESQKLQKTQVEVSTIAWIKDYPTNRPQFVRLKNCTSNQVISNIGAPQGTVLSPFLFTLYTSDFQYKSETCHLQKYSDDSAVVGCIRDGQEAEYRELVERFVAWCGNNHLTLNVNKTKEMILRLQKKQGGVKHCFHRGRRSGGG
nr:arginyl-tRNA--protein transferase 1 isoform X4 [Nothobranchius furzeri]